MNFPTTCKPGCGHSAAEHAAFDAGLKAGNAGRPDACPHTERREANAWRAGWTTGHLNRRTRH